MAQDNGSIESKDQSANHKKVTSSSSSDVRAQVDVVSTNDGSTTTTGDTSIIQKENLPGLDSTNVGDKNCANGPNLLVELASDGGGSAGSKGQFISFPNGDGGGGGGGSAGSKGQFVPLKPKDLNI